MHSIKYFNRIINTSFYISMSIVPIFVCGLILAGCQKELTSFSDAIKKCKSIPLDSLIYPNPDCLLGAQLPNFNAQTIDGKIIDDDYIYGKINIINFWFETCPPCVAEIPGLNKVKNQYGTSEINYLAIGNDRWDHIKEFITRHPFNYDLVADGERIYRNTFQTMWGYPFTIITNKQGLVIDAFGGNSSDSTASELIFERISNSLETQFNL